MRCDSLCFVANLFGVVRISGDDSTLQRKRTEINCLSDLGEANVSIESNHRVYIFLICSRVNHEAKTSIGHDY